MRGWQSRLASGWRSRPAAGGRLASRNHVPRLYIVLYIEDGEFLTSPSVSAGPRADPLDPSDPRFALAHVNVAGPTGPAIPPIPKPPYSHAGPPMKNHRYTYHFPRTPTSCTSVGFSNTVLVRGSIIRNISNHIPHTSSQLYFCPIL